jgi:CheY-like chemotaxis protein
MKQQPISILAVDDEPGILALVRSCFEDDERITLTVASGGNDALQQLTHGAVPDLLITDVRMPEMEGDELARRARLLEPNLKVLYLTSYTDGLFEGRPELPSEEAYLDKPFTRQGLREAAGLLLFGHTVL